jgi:hypothetical protein
MVLLDVAHPVFFLVHRSANNRSLKPRNVAEEYVVSTFNHLHYNIT